MTLIVGIGPIVYALNHPDPQITSLLFCKLRGYIFQIGLMLSRWYIAFACIDRYISTSDQMRLRRFANKKIAYRVIIIVIIFWSIICSHRLIFYEIKGSACGILSNVAAALYHSAYVIFGGGVLPSAIMMICACLIRRNLTYRQQRRERLALGDHQRKSLDQQLLSILFVQIICYIIFIIPQLVNLTFNSISITVPNRSAEHLAVERFMSFFAEVMLYLFPVTSFYLYTLVSRTFRRELIKFFYSIYRLCLGNRIAPMINGSTVAFHLEQQQQTTITARIPSKTQFNKTEIH